MSATAAASESSFPLERLNSQDETELAPEGALEHAELRRMPTALVSILVLAEIGWLGAIGYGFLLLVR